MTVKTVLAKDPVRHLASRATFGATPKVLADIRRMGIDAWVRQQLDPEKIAPSAAELKLAELPTLKLTSQQLRDQREQLNERGRSRRRRWSTARWPGRSGRSGSSTR